MSITLLRSVMPELLWTKEAVVHSDGVGRIKDSPYKHVIPTDELPRLNRMVILVEAYEDMQEVYVWAIGESFEKCQWYVLGHKRRSISMGDWVQLVAYMRDTFHGDYIWVTQPSVYAALKLARFAPQMMGQEVH